MGYVNPENLSIREVKIRTMAQFWLFICLGSVALWILIMVLLKILEEKCCKKGEHRYKSAEIKAILGDLYG